MNRNPAQRRILVLTGLVFTALWSAFLIVSHMTGRSGALDALEYRFADLRFMLTGPQPASPDVVIVAIDDDTLVSNANGRDLFAQLINNIAQSGARTLAVDVLLAETGDPADNIVLADALASLPSVIAAAAVFSDNSENPTSLIWPQPIFQDAAQVGLVNLSTDAGGTPRYAPLLIDVDGEIRPSLALLAALAGTGENATFGETQLTLGDRPIPLDLGHNMPLRYVGPAGSVPTLSANDILDGPMPDAFSGKIVVLGNSASAMGDRFSTPFDDSTPGVEIIATAISQLTGGSTLRRDMNVRMWDAVHAMALALLCVFFVMVWPLSRSLPLAIAMTSLSLIALVMIFSAGIWMSAALPLAAAVPSVLVAGGMRYAQERQQANRSERAVASLRRFQSPALAAEIENDPEFLAAPIEQDLVSFFVDLTGFTSLSQRLGPKGTRNLLRVFHALVSETVETRGGIVFNFMGDGAIAVFGLKNDTVQPAANSAMDAAFDLAHSLSKQKLAELPDENLGCRIGLHAGPTTLSRMGAESHQQVTVTGDSVNLASRLMEVAKEEKAVIVASGDLVAALSKPIDNETAQQTEVAIRGRAGRVQVLTWSCKAVAQKYQGNATHSA